MVNWALKISYLSVSCTCSLSVCLSVCLSLSLFLSLSLSLFLCPYRAGVTCQWCGVKYILTQANLLHPFRLQCFCLFLLRWSLHLCDFPNKNCATAVFPVFLHLDVANTVPHEGQQIEIDVPFLSSQAIDAGSPIWNPWNMNRLQNIHFVMLIAVNQVEVTVMSV